MEKKEGQKWQRIHNKYKLIFSQGTATLYLRETNGHSAKRVLAKDDIFDVLEELHVNTHEHSGKIVQEGFSTLLWSY